MFQVLNTETEHRSDLNWASVSGSFDPRATSLRKCVYFVFIYFIYCEVKMGRSSVNVAKGKPQHTMVPLNYCVTIKGKQMIDFVMRFLF